MNINLVYKEKTRRKRMPFFLFETPLLRILILMKTIVLLILVFSLQVSAKVNGQTINLTLKDAPLSTALEQISKQTRYDFSYSDRILHKAKLVSITLRNETLESALQKLLTRNSFDYEILDRIIIIKEKKTSPILANALPGNSKAQALYGRVTNDKGEPLSGVSVQINGTSIGTSTDANGNYRIDGMSTGAVLTFRFLGFITQELAYTGQSELSVVLKILESDLDEVVVVGYGTQLKKTLTGAVSVIKFDDIEATGLSTVSHALAGKASGLRVNQMSAQPGGGVKLKIRGEASGGAGSEPLIVIDGFPIGTGGNNMDTDLSFGQMGSVDNVLASLNPDDIESISVLKDAASTSIYGARAGHGVILITTKRGRNQKTQVTYSGQASLQKMSDKFQILDVREFMDMRNRQYYENYLANNGLGIYADYIKTNENPPLFVPHYTNDQILRMPETNWLDLVTRTGNMNQHNIQLRGGSSQTRYLVSVNYMEQAGIVKENNMKRVSGRFNFDQDLSSYVSTGITMTYSQNSFDNVPLGNHSGEFSGIIAAAVRANPTHPVYDNNGKYFLDPLRSFAPNPVSLLDYKDLSVNDRLLASGNLIVKPLIGLVMKTQLSVDRRFQKRSAYIPKTTVEGQRSNGAARVAQSDASDYLLDFNINYEKSIEEHKFKGLAGYAFQIYNNESISATARDFITDAFLWHNLSASAAERQNVGSSASKRSIASYFGRLNYSYANRYLVEATLRTDGSSNFHPDHRWGYFPSASLGWVFSDEKFLSNRSLPWFSNGKLRMSYGSTGNENVGYGLQNAYAINWRNAILGDAEHKGAYVSALGNKDLTWETTTEFNLGLDLGLFNDRMDVTFEYFNRQVKDMLQGGKPIPSYNEVTTIVANAGKVQSRGYEVTLNTKNIVNDNLNWTSSLTLSHYVDKWKERPAFIAMKPYQKNNDPFHAWWAYESLGIMRAGDPVPAAQKDLLPGMVILKDQNNDGVIDDKDMVYQGSGSPKMYFGFNNTVKFKNFDFNVFFYGETGNTKGTSYKEKWTFMDVNQAVNVSVWSNKSYSSTNQNAQDPTFLKQGTYGWGDYYVRDIYYIRCGSMTLGYTIPVKKNLVNNIRVFTNINNPFVITNWTGLDPETDNGDFPYPNMRSFGLGLNLTF